MTFLMGLSTLLKNHYNGKGQVIGIKMKKILLSLIYDKLGRVSLPALNSMKRDKVMSII